MYRQENKRETGQNGKYFQQNEYNIFEKKEGPKKINVEVVKEMVSPTILYSSETWTLTERQKSRINAMKMRKNYKQKRQNKKRNVQTEFTNVTSHWFRCVCRMSSDRFY